MPLKGIPNPLKSLKEVSHLDVKDTVVKAIPNTVEDIKSATRKMLEDRGTESLLDLPLAGLRKVPYIGKKVMPPVTDFVTKTQEALRNFDTKAGDTLAKTKLGDAVFSHVDAVPVAKVVTEDGKVADAFASQKVHRLTAPIDKAKGVAVPILAAVGADTVAKGIKNQKSKGGEETLADVRNDLIEKIAETMQTNSTLLHEAMEKQAAIVSKAKVAAEMLKVASDKISFLEEETEKLATENELLKLQILAKERSHRSIKLAESMMYKGMIKQAEFDSKVDYIMGLNDDGYNLLSKTVESVPSKLATYGQNGLDKLSYVLADDTSSQEKSTLEDAILNLSR